MARSLGAYWLLGVVATAAGCGDDSGPAPPDDADDECKSVTLDLMAAPSGVQRGEPYRWLARRWQSPLGFTIATYGLAIDGLPVVGRHQVEIRDRAGQLVHRAGSGDAVLAALRAQRATLASRQAHPLAALSSGPRRRARSLRRHDERAVWYFADGALVPAVAAERVDLTRDEPLAEVTLRDAVTGAPLASRRAIFDLADPEYLVYARDDGRPLYSPLGDTLPHPTGAPNGQVPGFVTQQPMRHSAVAAALADPWLPAEARETRGNNVVAFFNSILDSSGKIAELVTDDGRDSPEYGPGPDLANRDFFALASASGFSFVYDPTRTASEYFQTGEFGASFPAPDPNDVALRAKIVQAFYSANWLHDYFYDAGFNEVAGNAQQSNYGRGGQPCDPLLVHAGFLTTFAFPSVDSESPVLSIGLNPRSATLRDSSMDFSVLAHEWGHYLIGRLAGGTADEDGMGNLQGRSLHEGIADFVGILVNLDEGDDLEGAFAVGTYFNLDYIERRPTLPAAEAAADAAYYGIRRYPYSLDVAKNPLTFRHLAVPPPLERPFYNWKGRGPVLAEEHTAGEVFSQALFQCFGNVVAAHPGATFESSRALMARYLVAGLIAFPDHPTFLDARNAVLTVVRLASPDVDYPACRAGFALRGMGAGALGPDREFGKDEPPPTYAAADVVESFLDEDRAVRLTSSMVVPMVGGAAGAATLQAAVRNAGMLLLGEGTLTTSASLPAAVTFPDGASKGHGELLPEGSSTVSIPVVIDACLLPVDAAQAGFRTFEYAVQVTSGGANPVTHQVTYRAAIAEPAGGCSTARRAR